MSSSSLSNSVTLQPTSPLALNECKLRRARRRGWTPPPRISVPAWADEFRYHKDGTRWRTAEVEIARGPMLSVTEPGVHIITTMVATQLLKTSLLENVMGRQAHLDPCDMLLVQPKEDAAEQFSKERITPLINATPVLKGLIGTAKTRKAEETLLFKSFPGGFLALVGAGSPDNLARRPVRIVMYDEVDKYPVTREGDPIDIGDERTAKFSNWLSIRACSPTVKDESRIEASYLESDQRRASVACPDCGHRQFPDFFKHVEWDKSDDGRRHRTETARIYCEVCSVGWTEGQRRKALQTIRWHQTRPFDCCGEHQSPLDAYESLWRGEDYEAVDKVWDWWQSDLYAVYRAKCGQCGDWAVPNEHAGFQAGKLFSPWAKDSPAHIAKKWIAADGDEDKKQVWHNTVRKNVLIQLIFNNINYIGALRRSFFLVEPPRNGPQENVVKLTLTELPRQGRCARDVQGAMMKKRETGSSVDLLYGMEAIGSEIGLTARQVEHLVSLGELPTFKMGRTVCARRSTLAKHFAAQEAAARAAGGE
ncbi:MAG TPA: phage terminase large subunit family protein [Sphingobium sp.]|uniref:phage terminase large subunit family protein n=1 Tax=Sphingobium sp. TaxID=1912891 RepID=UPI002ED226DC